MPPLTIETQVFVKAAQYDLSALRLLVRLQDGADILGLDLASENRIFRDYNQALEATDNLWRILQEIILNHSDRFPCELPEPHRVELHELGCNDMQLLFMGVAYGSKSQPAFVIISNHVAYLLANAYIRDKRELHMEIKTTADVDVALRATPQNSIANALLSQRPTIGVVVTNAAEGYERIAMEVLLDNRIDFKEKYVLGEIKTHTGSILHVVLAQCEQGTNLAASITTHLLRDFPNVRQIVMTGIAGGVPNLKDPDPDIQLGDVVLPDIQGAINYGYGKLTPDGLQIRPRFQRPSRRLLGAARKLQAREKMNERPWLPLIQRSLDSLKPVTKPLEFRDSPKIHFGAIGSTDVLLQDPQKAKDLYDKHKILAIEMELSGVVDATWDAGAEYFVVRGISDYCDVFSKKTNESAKQGYAAVIAASYTRALLETLDH